MHAKYEQCYDYFIIITLLKSTNFFDILGFSHHFPSMNWVPCALKLFIAAKENLL
jgi:hypothetical protein